MFLISDGDLRDFKSLLRLILEVEWSFWMANFGSDYDEAFSNLTLYLTTPLINSPLKKIKLLQFYLKC